MNLVDSSGWLEYFADETNAGFFAPAIEDAENLVVPTISLYEVFKRVLQQRGEGPALQAVAMMEQGQIIDMNSSIALLGAKLSHDLKLPMADALILATARSHQATLWSQDEDFSAISGVRYIAKKR